MKAFFYALTLAFIISSTTMAAPHKLETFELKYLSAVTHGKVVHRLKVQAVDFNEALTKSRKQCLNDLLDRKFASDDIIDMCANPRL